MVIGIKSLANIIFPQDVNIITGKTEVHLTPYVRIKDDIRAVMLDVILALIPAIIASAFVYGLTPLLLIATSVISAVITEKIFSFVFYKKSSSVNDLSSIITGILLPMTLGPFTSIPVTMFGASMAVIFGKLIFGGVGRNRLNPAIVGREFMTVFFGTAMASGANWYNQDKLIFSDVNIFKLFGNNEITNYLDSLILNPSGIVGGYSVIALVIGGIYLIYKNRISWHVPVALFLTIAVGNVFYTGEGSIAMGGIMLTGIFMATDMPSSPTYSWGKFYYGMMMAIVMFVLWKFGIFNEALSYIILIMNIFAVAINKVCRPVVFGYKLDWLFVIAKLVILSIGIITFSVFWSYIHNLGYMSYVVYAYVIITACRLVFFSNEIK